MSREDDKDRTQFRRPASYRRNEREAAQAAHARQAEGRRVASATRQAAQRPQAERIRRPQHAQRPAMAPRGHAGGAAPAQGYVPDYQFDYGHRRGHGGLSAALLVLAVVFRLAAIGLAALVVANAFTLSGRVDVAAMTARVSAFVPGRFSAMPMVDTPFGGVFRGDLALASLVLFVLDWICSRVRYRVRY